MFLGCVTGTDRVVATPATGAFIKNDAFKSSYARIPPPLLKKGGGGGSMKLHISQAGDLT